jgi:hypothetical protein
MAKIDDIKEFVEERTNSLREEIAFFGRNPQTQEEKQIVAIYSSQLALLEEISLIVDSEK